MQYVRGLVVALAVAMFMLSSYIRSWHYYNGVYTESIVDRDDLQSVCQETKLCDTANYQRTRHFPLDYANVKVDCDTLFRNTQKMDNVVVEKSEIDKSVVPEQFKLNSLSNQVDKKNIKEAIDAYSSAEHFTWSSESFNLLVKQIQKKHVPKNHSLFTSLKKLRNILNGFDIRGKNILVFGKDHPSIQAFLLANEAQAVYTVAHKSTSSLHEKIRIMSIAEFDQAYLSGELPLFDLAISFQFIAEYGLGKHGESFNAWGDLFLVQKMWCASSRNSSLVLSVPFNNYEDSLIWPETRVYGRVRYPLLLSNWRISRILPNAIFPISLSYKHV